MVNRNFSKNQLLFFFQQIKFMGIILIKLNFQKKKLRFDFKEKKFQKGINENFNVDNCTHSLLVCLNYLLI